MMAAMSEFVAHYVRQVFHEHARSATAVSKQYSQIVACQPSVGEV